jgi:hypothetical protein
MRELNLQEIESVSGANGGVDTNTLGTAMGAGGAVLMTVGVVVGMSNPVGWGCLAFGAIWGASGAYIAGQGAFS